METIKLNTKLREVQEFNYLVQRRFLCIRFSLNWCFFRTQNYNIFFVSLLNKKPSYLGYVFRVHTLKGQYLFFSFAQLPQCLFCLSSSKDSIIEKLMMLWPLRIYRLEIPLFFQSWFAFFTSTFGGLVYFFLTTIFFFFFEGIFSLLLLT